MRVLLIRPPKSKSSVSLGDFMFAEPLGLECICALLKDRHEVKILDLMVKPENLLDECQTWNPSVVGFTTLCVDVQPVLELAAQIKALNPAITVIVGGTQAFLSPESYYCAQIDHVIKCSTAKNVNTLFEFIEKGEKIPVIPGVHSRAKNYESIDAAGFNDYIIPDRSSTQRYRHHYSWFGYKPCAILQTSRGCSSVCSFCLRWQLEGCTELTEPMSIIVPQLKAIEEPNIMITDNDFLRNGQRLQEFCDALETNLIKKNFLCYGSVQGIVTNTGVIKRLAKNGLKAIIVGFESFKAEDLTSYRKKSTMEMNLTAAKILKELGISCWASFILNPDWNGEDFRELRNYLRLIDPEFAALSPLTPFPGSPLYDHYKDRVIYTKDDFDNWSFSIVTIMPSKLSLRRYYYEVLKTNLYVNMFVNRPMRMLKKYDASNFFRILWGSIKFIFTYLKLLLKG